MGKKILVLGTGAQGPTVAKRLDLEPNVDKIICADYDEAAAKELAASLNKAEGYFCNASDKDQITPLLEGCDLVVNALPLAFGKNVIDAALEAKKKGAVNSRRDVRNKLANAPCESENP